MAQALVVSPTEGEKFVAGPFDIISRVLGSQNNDTFEMYELAMGPATIDYHVHHHHDETLVVLEGEIEFIVAKTNFLRPAGSVAFVPRGIHHGFTNHGPTRARVLIMFTPNGNQQEYFRELASIFAQTPLDMVRLKAAQKQYDQELIAMD